MLARRPTQPVNRGTGHVDGAVEVAAELVAALGRAAAHPDAEVEALGIGRDERLGKDHELRALSRGARREVADPGYRGVCVEHHGRALHDGGDHRTRHSSNPRAV